MAIDGVAMKENHKTVRPDIKPTTNDQYGYREEWLLTGK